MYFDSTDQLGRKLERGKRSMLMVSTATVLPSSAVVFFGQEQAGRNAQHPTGSAD